MPQPPQTARSERTRDALRRAALLRFEAQGVEATSAEQIAEDAGVTQRTFYRHFNSKHDLLFADYDAQLHWFRTALEARPLDEPITQSVRAAMFEYPYDHSTVAGVADLRNRSLDADSIERHIRQVQAEFASEIEGHLLRARPSDRTSDEAMLTSVTAHCIAAAVFAAMETWMRGEHSSLDELARLAQLALDSLEQGLTLRRQV